MKLKFDSSLLGFALGVIAPAVTFMLLLRFYYPFDYFETFFKGYWLKLLAPKVMSLSVIPNLALFFLFIYTHRYKSARGALGATILIAVAVFIIKLSA